MDILQQAQLQMRIVCRINELNQLIDSTEVEDKKNEYIRRRDSLIQGQRQLYERLQTACLQITSNRDPLEALADLLNTTPGARAVAIPGKGIQFG